MLDEDNNTTGQAAEAPAGETEAPAKKAAKKAPRRTTKKATAEQPPPADDAAPAAETDDAPAPAKKATKKAAAKKTAAKKTTAKKTAAKKTTAKKASTSAPEGEAPEPTESPAGETEAPAKKATKRAPRKKAAKTPEAPVEAAAPGPEAAGPEADPTESAPVKKTTTRRTRAKKATEPAAETPTAEAAAPIEPSTDPEAGQESGPVPLFQAPEPTRAPRSRKKAAPKQDEEAATSSAPQESSDAGGGTDTADGNRAKGDAAQGDGGRGGDHATDPAGTDGSEDTGEKSDDDSGEEQGGGRRRRRRGGRRRRKNNNSGDADQSANGGDSDSAEAKDAASDQDSGDSEQNDNDSADGAGSRRRRRRRRAGESGGDAPDDPANTVTRVRRGRSSEDQITAVSGSTRLEAKKQRRREGREAGRRRAPIVSEAEFLARRESVDRVMVIRQQGELTQIGVLEDKVLVEHYVARESQNSLIGNVYLGRVQNVLPSMEAAFIDIGKGRNAVLYAGEVNWSALGHKDGQPRKIESVLSSGQSVLVQVTKDPVGHKGARLTSQVSLAGRFLVYVPDGTTAGISRKLPDTERSRLKGLLKEIVPDDAGVIVRTAAEGASEEELTRDVERLKARWDDIETKSKQGSGPKMLYGEPDLTLKVVRDLFTEDFSKLVVEGDEAWDTVHGYVEHVAPDLLDRVERFEGGDGGDSFAVHRIDEQIAKGLDRKVWLPSGGSLIIDRTEAMTVVDVNTGKFTGSGGNLEETVTKNNLEAAEEIVRQLRLRDIGGIIVVDFIDMVLESNRDLVLRRLVECLGRDRTRHQVAEVTSLGLVQMTRKRIGTGLLEAFSENCEHCAGRGVVLHDMPIEPRRNDDDSRRGRRSKGGKNGNGNGSKRNEGKNQPAKPIPSPKDVAAVARPDAEPVIRPEDVAAEEAAGSSGAGGPEVASGPAEARGAKEREDVKASAAEGDHSRGKDASASESAGKADTTVVEPGARDEATPTARTTPEPAARPEAESPAADAAPTVSTVTRSRRSARSGVITPKASEPVVTPETPEVPTAAAATAPPPKLVTRSRRRGAARDAAAPQEDGAEEGGTA